MVLRHDVDTDPTTAAAMWQIARSLGVRASFYFRLSTLDIDLMRRIAESGSEAGYHYEEAATVAKRERLRTRERALQEMPRMRDLFRRNLDDLRKAAASRSRWSLLTETL